ncbi:MAG: tetratricopeptide repeat protein [Spirochaetales bacterium]|nr:tetratricopeptide repeat protein [Spirochaetales bacterium]
MMLNADRYRYTRKKRRRIPVLLIVLLAAAAGLGVLAWQLDLIGRVRGLFRQESQPLPLAELWDNRLYEEIIARCDERLREEPLDTQALVFRGFAYFYRAVSEVTLEERIPFLDESIVSLRQAMLGDENPWAAETSYVLGKAYYHRGKYYYDLTIEYLERALEAGYQADDIYDYLGLAATQLDRVEEGLRYFFQALEINPTDLLLLMIGQSYLQLGRTEEAEEYLIRAVNKTDDKAVEKRSRLLLGQLYFDAQDFFKAEKEYLTILEIDPNSAEAHFNLGEIYLKMNDLVRARAEWRKTLIIDPSHYGARLRYYR